MKNRISSKELEQLDHSAQIGISIVNYYSAASIERLLSSLRQFFLPAFVEICIVDNSLDSTRAENQRLAALVDAYSSDGFNIIVYTSDENLGYGSGNNLAAEILLQKHLDLIWVLNPDTHVTGKAASLLREIAASSADIFSTRTIEDNVSSNGSSTISTLTGKTSRPRQQTFEQRLWSFDYPSGHSIIFKRDAWLKLNGFNDRYFLFMEEADLTLRAHALNLKIAALSEVTVQHNQGLTTGSSKDILSKSNVAFRESTKSRIIFFREHFLSRLPLLLLTRIAYAAYVYARGNKPGARAIVDGLMTGIGITVKK